MIASSAHADDERFGHHDHGGWLLDDVVRPDARVRQGDLIRFESVIDPLRANGIVVTADCDLEQKKHARILTLVPVVSVVNIVEYYLFLEDCDKKRDLIERFVFREFFIKQEYDHETKIAMLREAVSSTKESIPSLKITAAKFMFDEIECLSTQNYKSLMHAIRSSPKKIESIKSQLRNRGDLFMLPEAPSIGIEGCVAWVRRMFQVPLCDVALRTSEVNSHFGERVARLDSPYRYRLTQLIAQVFSDIGLPDVPSSADRLLEEAYK